MSELLLNVGSGQRPFKPPWINIDKQAKWYPDILWDFGNPLESPHYKDDTVDMIVMHHILEHYGCGEASNALTEAHRLLKPNGSLLVFVPDMYELGCMWREGRISDQVYMTNVYGAYMGDDADRHRWGYTKSSLKSVLLNIGFKAVTSFNWRMIEGADLAQARWVLAVEAIR